jgi:hypothetical protein
LILINPKKKLILGPREYYLGSKISKLIYKKSQLFLDYSHWFLVDDIGQHPNLNKKKIKIWPNVISKNKSNELPSSVHKRKQDDLARLSLAQENNMCIGTCITMLSMFGTREKNEWKPWNHYIMCNTPCYKNSNQNY